MAGREKGIILLFRNLKQYCGDSFNEVHNFIVIPPQDQTLTDMWHVAALFVDK